MVKITTQYSVNPQPGDLNVCSNQPSSPLKRMLSCFSSVPLFVTPWTVSCQASLSVGFSRQGYWSGLLFLIPGTLPDPGIEPESLTSPALAGRLFATSTTWEALPPGKPCHLGSRSTCSL